MRLAKPTVILLLLFTLAFALRIFGVGQMVFKEEENSTVKASAYIYYCQQENSNCLHQVKPTKSKFLALLTGNETIPNSFAEVYFWDFIKNSPSTTHFSRAWPHLYLQAAVYHLLGINEFSSRLVSVVAGSLLVVVGYWFSRTLGSRKQFSWFYSSLLALSFPLIDFSRNARMYSLYVVVFLLLVILIYRSKWLAAGLTFFLAYWLQLLTLILPIALGIWGLFKRQRGLVISLLLGLAAIAGLSYYQKVNLVPYYFLDFAWPPHWEYLKFLFSYPLPWWIGIVLFYLGKSNRFITIIISTYLIILIFFTKFPPGGAYVLALLPLVIWVQFAWIKSKAVWGVILLVALVRLALGSGYLYLNRDGRAQVNKAYQVIINQYQSNDKIYAIQLRDYYLQALPETVEVVDLQQNPQTQFIGSGFIVWEKEKSIHLPPAVLTDIKNNFKHLAGENLDDWGVEIYSFGK